MTGLAKDGLEEELMVSVGLVNPDVLSVWGEPDRGLLENTVVVSVPLVLWGVVLEYRPNGKQPRFYLCNTGVTSPTTQLRGKSIHLGIVDPFVSPVPA